MASKRVKPMTPPFIAVLIGAAYAVGIGLLIHRRMWAAAAALFNYGLALGLGCIYQAVRRPKD